MEHPQMPSLAGLPRDEALAKQIVHMAKVELGIAARASTPPYRWERLEEVVVRILRDKCLEEKSHTQILP